MEPVIGIDLGTTNSEVAVCVDGRIEIVEENGHPILPSFVGLSDEGKLLVGTEAKNQYLLFPENTVKSVKRKMGEQEKIKLGDKAYLPQEISAMILRELKLRAEKYLNEKVTKAVITVPAQFSDTQRQATREAGAIAGLEVLRIINEPTAASLAFKHDGSKKVSNILVFDLGGGTFDVSLVRMEGDVIEVVASHGNNKLGGDDFDDLLVGWIKQKVSKNGGKQRALDKVTEYRLSYTAEKAKLHLTEFTHAKIIETGLKLKKGSKVISIDEKMLRADFEELLTDYVDEMTFAVHQTLDDAKLKVNDIDDIVLVGGSTRIPLIPEVIEKEFNIIPRTDVHPELAVAYGAGVMAARLMGENEHRVLIDITPHSFGISCLGDVDGVYCPYYFSQVIKSASPLPVVKEELFSTVCEGQEKVDVNIFQGENIDARKNIFIGRFLIENLSKTAPAGSALAVNMRLDLNGILKVTAVEVETGLSKHVTIEDSLSKLSDFELKNSRNEIQKMFHQGENNVDIDIDIDVVDDSAGLSFADNNNSELASIRSRLDSARDAMDDEDRNEAESLFQQIEKSYLKNSDTDKIESLKTELEDILFYLEAK